MKDLRRSNRGGGTVLFLPHMDGTAAYAHQCKVKNPEDFGVPLFVDSACDLHRVRNENEWPQNVGCPRCLDGILRCPPGFKCLCGDLHGVFWSFS